MLTEELQALPQAVRDLAEAQRRTEERMGQLIQAHETLARKVTQLAEQVERLVEVHTRMSTDLERLKGSDLERRYREWASGYFRRLLRQIHALSHEDLAAFLEDSMAQGKVSYEDADEVLQTGLVVQGRRRDTQQEIYLVVEVSWDVGIQDVERTAERAALLARTGAPAGPVVAGSWVTHDAQAAARDSKVWQVLA